MKKMILAVLVTATLMACDSATNSNESNNSNGNGTALTGSVLTSEGKPVVGAKITIKSTKQSVYTDANGKWSLNVSTTKASIGVTGQAVAGRSLAGTDSAVVSKDSQYIASQPIVSYTAELPALYIVQRDLYGNLANAVPGETYTITAVMAFPDSSRKTIALWHNAVAKSFSGFIYTVWDPSITRSYNVQVTVRDHDSVVTGVSPVVPFTDAAGDVLIPVFGYENTKPKINRISVAGGYTAGSTVVLGVVYGDSDIVNGVPVQDTMKNNVEWKHGDSAWVTAKTAIFRIGNLSDPCYTVRVTDNETLNGSNALDSLRYCLEPSGKTAVDTTTMLKYTYSAPGLNIDSTGDSVLLARYGYSANGVARLNTDTLAVDSFTHTKILRQNKSGVIDTSTIDVAPEVAIVLTGIGAVGYVSESTLWSSDTASLVHVADLNKLYTTSDSLKLIDTLRIHKGDNVIRFFDKPDLRINGIYSANYTTSGMYKYLLGQNPSWKGNRSKFVIKAVKTYK
jgi:hypothetical protein